MLKKADCPGATSTVVGLIAVKLYVPFRTTLVGSDAPEDERSCSPG